MVAIILLMHSIPGMLDGGVNAFGTEYLDKTGFAPAGLILAWGIKLSHIVCAVLLLTNRFVKLACIITVFILVVGICMVHLKEGWFVVGGGKNGVEFNLLLITVLVYIMMEDKIGCMS